MEVAVEHFPPACRRFIKEVHAMVRAAPLMRASMRPHWVSTCATNCLYGLRIRHSHWTQSDHPSYNCRTGLLCAAAIVR